MSKQLLNDPASLVTEAIEGFLACNPQLQRLDGFPNIKVVVDPRHDNSKVAVISGGGSGHEPAHIGYVGRGMLAAAVAGEVFASPPASAVLAAIRAVTGPGGCLLLVKNYTGDRLHFGLAAEQAKAEGHPVAVVVVGEDAAIATPGMAGRRGLAGTVLLHKIAGAAAAAGASLSAVADIAQRVAGSCATLGVALRACTLPGHPPNNRLAGNQIELGLGIHGEPGAALMDLTPAHQLVDNMMRQLVEYTATRHLFTPGARVALLLNNLGATTPLELNLLAAEAAAAAQRHQLAVVLLLSGPFVTSLDMAGASITLLALTPDMEPLLAAATDAPAWPNNPNVQYLINNNNNNNSGGSSNGSHAPSPPKQHIRPAPIPLPMGPEGQQGSTQQQAAGVAAAGQSHQAVVMAACIAAAAQALVAAAAQLNELDAKGGDGDCGDTLAGGASALLAALDSSSLATAPPAAALSGISASIQTAMGGTSGGLYQVALTAAAAVMQKAPADNSGSVKDWAEAFAAGVAAVERYGGAAAGCKTMLDALLPAAEAVTQAAAAGQTGAVAAAAAAAAAAAGAESTKGMTALAGRASYAPEAAVGGSPDPGAVAVATWLAAVARVLQEQQPASGPDRDAESA